MRFGRLVDGSGLRRLRMLGAATLVIVASASFIGRAQEPEGAVAARSATARVVEATPEHRAIAARKEHCAIGRDLLETIGVEPGHQVRVTAGGAAPALFTVRMALDDDPDAGEGVFLAGTAGLRRIGGPSTGSEVLISSEPARTDLEPGEARRLGELIELLEDDGEHRGLLVLAPLGGMIERSTDEQAERVRLVLDGLPVSSWRLVGSSRSGDLGAFTRWHITSTDLHEASFPKLGAVADREFAYALSFHGMSREGVLIGGAAPMRLKREVRDAIRRAVDDTKIPVDVAMPGDPLGGSSPRNVVNRFCPGGGVQIEQGPGARREHAEQIADAVAEVFRGRLEEID